MNHLQLARDNLIFECIAGSRAYGTAMPDSDMDIRGIFIAPPEYSLGAFKRIKQMEEKKTDIVYHELDKFVRLASDCNPNVIELLFTPPENIRYCNEIFMMLKRHAHLFLSTRAKHTFCGYAIAQLKRIKGHRKWISNPAPEEPPPLRQYCSIVDARNGHIRKPDEQDWKWLNRHAFLVKASGEQCFRLFVLHTGTNEQVGIISNDGTNLKVCNNTIGILNNQDVSFIGTLICDIKKFKEARKHHKEYWNWKKNRNPIRAALEEKYGFDCKHALHLVRLMKMAEEILTGQGVIVHRPDAQELLDIRNGKFQYEELIAWAEETDQRLNAVYKTSSLPKYPDIKAIDEIVMQMKQKHWKKLGLLSL